VGTFEECFSLFHDKLNSLLLSLRFTQQILEEKHQLSFHLQQQQLIELIREGKTEEALEFAQEYLAPRGEENPAFLEELGESPCIYHGRNNSY
jgi:hypothetical protein